MGGLDSYASSPGEVAKPHVVFMGQGEPLYNYRNVKKAIDTLCDPDGLALPRKRVTVSTAGVAPLIAKVGTELGVNLAVSLHAPTEGARGALMDVARQYHISDVMEACREYQNGRDTLTPGRRITFEYVLLAGVNDSEGDAITMATLIKRERLLAHVNVIPFNPWPGARFACPSSHTIRLFEQALAREGIGVTTRWPKGRDILAACGQLKTSVEEEGMMQA